MRLPIAVIALAALMACLSEPASAPTPCLQDVTLTRTPDNLPAFTWKPACGVSRLEVTDSATGTPLWTVGVVTARNLMPPPVAYGRKPRYPYCPSDPNAGPCDFFIEPAEPLVPGTPYRVEVIRTTLDSVNGFGEVIAGALFFRP